MINPTFIDIRDMSAAEKFENIIAGMTVEYCDAENDMDEGNYGKVLATDLDVAAKAFTGVPFYRYLVQIQLSNGRKETIQAGSVLAVSYEGM